MPSIAITGSIGSGKSFATELLVRLFDQSGRKCAVFSADHENRRLLDTDDDVRNLIMEHLGKECYREDGTPDRSRIFRTISSDEAAKHSLESIMHPRLGRIWKPLAESYGKSKEDYFFAELPLLYEKDLPGFFNRVIVVAASEETRRQRLQSRRNCTPGEMARWESMQLPQSEKIGRANHLFWNDGTPEALEMQARHFLNLMTSR